MASRTDSGATSQQHGRVFERYVRDSGRFVDAINSKASSSEAIDINASFDKRLNLHTSVKVVGSGAIGLADAVRFYEIEGPFRMIIGHWKQVTPEIKHVTRVHEVIITAKTLKRLRGDITADEIRAMQEVYAAFPAGPVGKAAARKASERMMLGVGRRKGLVSLEFKADNKTQRRLQLSVRLKTLLNAVDDDKLYTQGGLTVPTREDHERGYYAFELPFEIESGRRQFSDPAASPQMSMDLGDVEQPTFDETSALLKPRLYVRIDDRARAASLMAFSKAEPRLIA